MSKDGTKVMFDHCIKTHNGWVVQVEIVSASMSEKVHNSSMQVSPCMDKHKCIKNVNDLCRGLGHPSEATTRDMGASMGIKVVGKFEPCDACILGKAKQRNANKTAVECSTIPGERLYLDISLPNTASLSGKNHWLLIVDNATDYVLSYFLKYKSNFTENVLGWIKELKSSNVAVKIVKYIHCDNAGENVALEMACKQEGLGIKFEYTAPGTPQQNGQVERKFATMYGKVQAMLNDAKLIAALHKKLWAKAANAATILKN